MALNFLNDPEHWRNRAEEARTVAEHMEDPGCRKSMLRIASEYETLAIRADWRLRHNSERAIAR